MADLVSGDLAAPTVPEAVHGERLVLPPADGQRINALERRLEALERILEGILDVTEAVAGRGGWMADMARLRAALEEWSR